jgi:hypothetical protein
VSEAAVVVVFALLAAHPAVGQGARSAAAVLGLIISSAILVHLSGGVIEMHFHFFVMLGVITLYQDWLPFGLALGYVVVHHGLLGTLRPIEVYNHPAAWRHRGRGRSSTAGSCWPQASPPWSPGSSARPRPPRSAGWSAAWRGWPARTRSPASPTGGYGTRRCPDHGPHRVGGHHGLEKEHHDREAEEDADE